MANKADNFSEATRNLKFFLISATNEKDIAQAKQLLSDIEVAEEMKASQHSNKEIEGIWIAKFKDGRASRYELTMNGNSFTLTMTSAYVPEWGWNSNFFPYVCSGVVTEDHRLSGICEADYRKLDAIGTIFRYPIEGVIDSKGPREINMKNEYAENIGKGGQIARSYPFDWQLTRE
jgi:hypothetical protein